MLPYNVNALKKHSSLTGIISLVKNRAKNIVLLHGWEARVERLRPLQTELTNLGWNVVNLKLPGFDLAPPENPWGLEDYANFVKREADHKLHATSYVLFGHSFGGRIAITLAATKPKNLIGLILCSSGGLSRPSLFKRAPLWLAAKVGRVVFSVIPGASLVKKSLYQLAREHDYEKTSGIMREVFKKTVKEDLKKKLSHIAVPTLILWGKKDKMTPYKNALLAQKLIPQAKLVSFDHIGHRLPYEKPQALAQEIDQWSGR